jgi:hypothetical protein
MGPQNLQPRGNINILNGHNFFVFEDINVTLFCLKLKCIFYLDGRLTFPRSKIRPQNLTFEAPKPSLVIEEIRKGNIPNPPPPRPTLKNSLIIYKDTSQTSLVGYLQ